MDADAGFISIPGPKAIGRWVVYAFFIGERCIYVGRSSNVFLRFGSHRVQSHPMQKGRLLDDVDTIRVWPVSDENAATQGERELIACLRPTLNQPFGPRPATCGASTSDNG